MDFHSELGHPAVSGSRSNTFVLKDVKCSVTTGEVQASMRVAEGCSERAAEQVDGGLHPWREGTTAACRSLGLQRTLAPYLLFLRSALGLVLCRALEGALSTPTLWLRSLRNPRRSATCAVQMHLPTWDRDSA